MTPFIAELIGTFFLILLGAGVVANVSLQKTIGHNAGWIVITFAWGLAVFTGVIVAGPHSGAHLNPAVTVGLAIAGLFPWSSVITYCIAQMLGAALGASVVWLIYKDHFDATEDDQTKLAVFSTGPAIRNLPRNFLSELVGTFALVFVILYMAGPSLQLDGLSQAKIGLGSIGALPVALLVVVIGMSLGGTTGYAINPARDLAPRLVYSVLPIAGKGSSNWSYAWVPVLGPLTGAGIASMLYLLLSH
ncbi:aquaporin family protein [Zooshikella marina]|uniref:Aquaporin family protein n=1 Tax=Zooshikella ganghwensis TaxID=202772 RepID=A0A4P9VL68_9GAMM|nr:MIP/aquaporin family protein [Zooshikella ganghwensis]MBU2708276.1 aquaporin family protein [Zooshikella ganghwensis]RDH44085.1 aquaporin family protein [Zooshikella ganghwensis]